MADIRVGTGVSNGTLLGVTTSFPFEYAYKKYVYMMYRRPGKIPAGAVNWYRWNNPTPGIWNLISPCTWNYGGQYYDYIWTDCRAGTGRYKVTFGGISVEYTVAEAPPPPPPPPTKASLVKTCSYSFVRYKDKAMTWRTICADATKELPLGTTIQSISFIKNTGSDGNLGLWIKDTKTGNWLCTSGKVWFAVGVSKQLKCTFTLDADYDIELHAGHYEDDVPIIDDSYGTFQLRIAPPECVTGQTKCVSRNFYECVDRMWANRGEVAGKCGVTPPITCDAPTPHFPSGCALLLHYDANGDGIIIGSEVNNAIADRDAGLIVDEELGFVIIVYVTQNGIINNKCPRCYTPPSHDTALSIAITDEAGNPITESVVGETVYITGQLRDIVDNVALQGALITLYRNGVATANTDITDASGIYSIPYTVTSADVPIVKFKTHFAGT